MKKIMIVLVSLFAFLFTAKASDDKPITFEQLPQLAQEFVKKYFADRTPSLVTVDQEMAGKSYDVIFSNGDDIEFDRQGVWTSIESRNEEVPDAVVTNQILYYVNNNYKDSEIINLYKDDR
ncbi:MAG: PepSY-like domain-containing protein [Bacteroidales bacterium]|nr:PepSY-like domain-containing protein [Bacteroidales bacterium]